MTTPVSARGVARRFGKRQALAGLDLDVGPAEIVGFVGPNGAGKSTFMRILLGLVSRDAGDVRVLDLDPATEDLSIRRRVAYLPGETSVYAGMTGTEFLRFALGFYPRTQELPRRAADLFELPLGRRIREYSAGMKQKLALLATLRPDVELYVLDEPDRALDATARLHLRELLAWLRDAGKAVLLSSHHLAEVDALANRCVFVFAGRRIPEERVSSARAALRHEVRLRVTEAIDLPGGAELVESLPDGTLRVLVDGEPLAWLALLPAHAVLAAEVGATRLEDLYRALSLDHEVSR
ncbi:MAG: ABC transporter ATP-binding protein [Planctomycetota bacterium]|nr:ABC transporter ATP-binding protein [Planctomycetota bacterium]MDA0933260.1 ABC transporter ATP-binding protein [Planctomycetota bacterium]